jgi:hypothetical protein
MYKRKVRKSEPEIFRTTKHGRDALAGFSGEVLNSRVGAWTAAAEMPKEIVQETTRIYIRMSVKYGSKAWHGGAGDLVSTVPVPRTTRSRCT